MIKPEFVDQQNEREFTLEDEFDIGKLFYREVMKIPLLSPDEERQLAKRFMKSKRKIADALVHIPVIAADMKVKDNRRTSELELDEFSKLIENVDEYIAGQFRILETKLSLAKEAGKNAEVERIEQEISDLEEKTGLPVEELSALLFQMRQGYKIALEAKNKLVESNIRLVGQIALGYRNLSLPMMDLIQEGNLGLMRAIERFDYRKGYKLSTYAFWWIRQAILRAIDAQSKTVRVPSYITEQKNKLNHIYTELTTRLGRRPTREEVADAANISISELEDIYQLCEDIVSLDMDINDDGGNQLLDILPAKQITRPDVEVTRKISREQLQEALATLAPRERKVITLRFGLSGDEPLTLREIGEAVGVSRERARQIEEEALEKLRHPERSGLLKELLEE